jgi:DnaJ-class molecular chaperone
MSSPPCGACGGSGGQTVDTSSDGVTRQTWIACGTCHGRGTR